MGVGVFGGGLGFVRATDAALLGGALFASPLSRQALSAAPLLGGAAGDGG